MLGELIVARKNLLITGAGGTGKTTLLSAILSEASPAERIVAIEDIAELRVDHPQFVSLQTRQPNIEGAGEIDLTRLVREALRMRPDRLVLGECRGAEIRDLLTALTLIEAEIDFPDEEVPDNLARSAGPLLDRLIADLKAALADAQRGERVRAGYRIVLIGETNAGKSSLFNALVAREAAIVTPIAGTTRDVLDADLIIGGYAVTLSDTAGLRDSTDPVELEGVRRARARAGAADLRLWVRGPDDAEGDAAGFVRSGDLLVLTKADLGTAPAVPGFETLALSTVTGQGLGDLLGWISARLSRDLAGTDFPAVTRERHRRRLVEALVAVEAGRAVLEASPEMSGDDLRRAAEALSRVTGAIGVEDILGEVFSTFCIGK
jgi:tRNA modification GTPase